ncbi:MAG TPA: biotin-dependent carboxyltransferase family protein [Vicinamibacterales bacterium]|jgi:antagonist of KipI
MTALTVIKPGMLTTVQDLGRRGYQGLGVPVAGPMDWYSHRRANQMLGNDPMAAALEVTLIGPELAVEGEMVAAVTGAAFEVTVDETAIVIDRPFRLASGARLRFGARRTGTRATLAVRGGLAVPVTLGSRATHLVSVMGGVDGRAIRAGDRLPIGADASATPRGGRSLMLPHGGATLRIVEAAHRERFTDRAWSVLTGERFTVTPQSNRMGYRLDGPPLEHSRGADLLSEAMPIGAIQVPASGQPILLMADRQTTGGYPTIANVITADLPLAGQLAPGDWIEFVACSLDAAIAALRAREAELASAGDV